MKFVGPTPPTVQNPEDVDGIVRLDYPVGNDVWRLGYNQFTRSRLSTGPSNMRLIRQALNGATDCCQDTLRRRRIAIQHVRNDVVHISSGPGAPNNVHANRPRRVAP